MDICEACDGTGQILKHPAGVRTNASYGVTCGACFGKGQYKSINSSGGQEKQEMSGHSGNSATFFGPMVAPHFKDMCLRVRNGYDSGINPTHSPETRAE